MQTCVHCNTPVPDDANFCFNCGSLVSDAEGQAAATGAMDDSSWKHMEKLLREDTEGEFLIERLLGRGGMAAVYLAKEVHLARKVAIKVLPPELTFGHGVERFMREAKTAAALDHPSIIPIYRISSGGKIFWYAMKYLEGESLEDHLKAEKKYSLDETVKILAQVADALDYGHEHQVIHRDIKPANIMLDSRHRVVVTDFGIAKALTEGTLTASGSVIGTPYYMSPEQGMGKPVTGASDQYSLAVTAFQMLSGQRPFEGDSAVEILHKHCMVEPPPLEHAWPEAPRHTSAAIRRALSKKGEQRFPTVSEFVEALAAPWEGSEDATLVAPAVPEWQRASTKLAPRVEVPKKRRWPAVLAAAAVVIAASGAGGWYYLTQVRDQSGGSRVDPTLQTEAATGAETAAQQTEPPPAEGGPTQPAGTQVEPAAVVTPPTPQPGTVTVVGLPASGTVSIDGRRQSGREFTLAAGLYAFRLEAQGYESQQETVEVTEGGTHSIRFTAARVAQPQPRPAQTQPQPPPAQPSGALALATLLIRVAPSAARIFVDGEMRREGTVYRTELPPGTHVIHLEREGYLPLDTTLTLDPGQQMTVELTLRTGAL